MITIYGISNCDTVKRARTRMDEHKIAYRFHDFRKDGLTAGQIDEMLSALGAEAMVNKRGTTWRGLSDEAKAAANGPGAGALLREHVALIKRPVWQKGATYKVGFARTEEEDILTWLKG